MFELLKLSADHMAYFEDAAFEHVVYHAGTNTLSLVLQVNHSLPFVVFKDFLKHLKNYTMTDVDIEIKTLHSESEYTDVQGYANYLFEQPVFSILKSSALKYTKETKEISFVCPTKEHYKNADAVVKRFQHHLHRLGIDLVCHLQMLEVDQESSVISVPQVQERQSTSQSTNRRRPLKTNYQPVSLEHLHEDVQHIAVEGVIFDVETRVTRKGGLIANYKITNGNSAIKAFKFYPDQIEDDVLKKGNSVRIYGSYAYKVEYVRDYQFTIDYAESIEPLFERIDDATEKRVEFHTHTKYSEMDGISDASEYIEQALAWGHPGLVLTDHAVVQSFPKAYKALKGLKKKYNAPDFKLGFGVEMNMVDADLNIVRSPNETPLFEGTYIVFDIETTGLSVVFDHIIEFGAVRIENGKVVDSMQCFIQSPVPLSDFTTQLTGITEEHMKQALDIDQAMQKIESFVADYVLVAHNASFDIDFLQEIQKNRGAKQFSNPVIDTLDLSRAMYEGRQSYRLGAVARQLKISYDTSVAHRADYDAEVLSLVFLEMLRSPLLKDMSTINDLNTLSDAQAFAKLRKQHVTVVAKSEAGLKKLYELISLSHTKYLAAFSKSNKAEGEFMAEPRILRSVLDDAREHFLIGAGCTASEVFEIAANKSDEALYSALKFYDYVEIMPLDYYEPLVTQNSLPASDRVIAIIQRLIAAAHEANVMVIASGNVHYNHPREKVIRDIYIHSMGIGGTRHPLFIYNQEKRQHFEAPDQHFRTTTEMLEAYQYLGEAAAMQYVVKNPKLLLDLLEEVSPTKKELFAPKIENADDNLKEIVYQNAFNRYGNPLPEIVSERIERELKSIIGHGFAVIYYISHLLVKQSLDDGYLVGSRGSVGSSFVATMAEITEVNPLVPHYVCESCHYHQFFENGEYSSGFDLEASACPQCGAPLRCDGQDIPFETFLGFEGDKVPDIDLNFSGAYQEVAHNYTKTLFGDEYVYRAGTISTVANRTAFGYVQGYYESMHINQTSQAWSEYLAMGAEGVKRTTGQHPGGIIVIPDYMDVHDFTPIQYPANNPNSPWFTTHFEFHDIDENVLKLDILGHVDPTAMKLLEKLTGIDILTVPMNDPKTLSLFESIEALELDERHYQEETGGLGIPEFGTKFVRRMLEATRPNKFSDLVRISGLSHGTDVWATNAEELIKDGMKLDQVIACRDDIMVYLMQHDLPPKTSFDIMESVRKGRGLREEWVATMREFNIPEWYIDSCIKIKYMFPKAHAVAYVMMAIRVAWFKVHQPLAYYATYFTLRVNAYEIETMTQSQEVVLQRLNDIESRKRNPETMRDVTIKEENLIDTLEVTYEMQCRGYKIMPIDLEQSLATQWSIHPTEPNAILPPFNVVDGLGDSVAVAIVNAREERPFISKKDLMSRTGVSNTVIGKLDAMHVTSNLQETNQLSLFDI